jgi:hypothetical protein
MNTKKTRDFIKQCCSRLNPYNSGLDDKIGLIQTIKIKCLDDQLEEMIYANNMDVTITPKIIKTVSVGDIFGGVSIDLADKSNTLFFISDSAVEIGILSESVSNLFLYFLILE